MILGIGTFEFIINELHVIKHFLFTSLTGTFPKAAIVDQDHIVIVAVEIARIFSPALNASGIAMEIQNKPFRIAPVEMEGVDTGISGNVKKILFEGGIVFELEVLFEPFGLEDELFLKKISQNA